MTFARSGTGRKGEAAAPIDAMVAIQKEAETQPDLVKSAPHTMTVRRLDDVRAARQLDLTWKPSA